MDDKLRQLTAGWTSQDFHDFLLFELVKSEVEITEEEKEAFIRMAGEGQWQKMERTCRKINDYEASQIIVELGREFLKTPEQKEQLIHDLKEICLADHHFTSTEQGLLSMIRHLIG